MVFCALSVFSSVLCRIAPDDSVRELEDMSHRSLRYPTKEAGSSDGLFFFFLTDRSDGFFSACVPQKSRCQTCRISPVWPCISAPERFLLLAAPLHSTASLTSRCNLADDGGRTVPTVKKSRKRKQMRKISVERTMHSPQITSRRGSTSMRETPFLGNSPDSPRVLRYSQTTAMPR
jgi:hypothetical protein